MSAVSTACAWRSWCGAKRRRTPAMAARRRSSARAPVCDQTRPWVGPSITHRNGPTGSSYRDPPPCLYVSHPHSSIPTSRCLPPFPRYAGEVVMPSSWRRRASCSVQRGVGVGITVGWIRGFEEGEEGVGRAVAAGLAVGRRGAGERSFFEREVGVEVDLGGLDLLVAEPERDDGGVDAGVQERHRGGVPQHVRRDRLVVQRRAALRRRVVACLASRRSSASRLSAPAACWSGTAGRRAGRRVRRARRAAPRRSAW